MYLRIVQVGSKTQTVSDRYSARNYVSLRDTIQINYALNASSFPLWWEDEEPYNTHTHPRQHTQHAPFLCSHWFLLLFSCLLNNRSAQRHIVFSDLLPALRTHSMLHSVRSTPHTTASLVFFLYLSKQTFSLQKQKSRRAGNEPRPEKSIWGTSELF